MFDELVPDELPLVQQFFPALSPQQMARLGRLTSFVRAWNDRVNLVSRRDVAHLELHHVLHSLAIARVWKAAPGATVVDIGTGGGFPGLPLAIVYPDCHFTLVDSIAKKTRAVKTIAAALGLTNVRVLTGRAENLPGKFDYALGRAVTALPSFLSYVAPLLGSGAAGEPPNGVFYFKGTLYESELAETPHQPTQVWPLQLFFDDPYFAGKFLLHFAAPLNEQAENGH